MDSMAQVLMRDTGVYLYHHSGAEGGTIKALKEVFCRSRSLWNQDRRWDDPEYLTAIIFREMVEQERVRQVATREQFPSLGPLDLNTFGIGTKRYKDVALLVTLYCASQTIQIQGKSEGQEVSRSCSFREFSSQTI